MNRFAEPEEVADTVAYLLSDSASMITGSCIPVDGGFLAC
jgi:L-xylulose reductase